jgi:hypothetical protein
LKATNEGAAVDGERDVEQQSDEDGDATEGDSQQNEQTSGDEQSVAEDLEVEAERRATGDPDESTRVASNWVREQKLETALPNPPKITSGEVVAHKTSELVTA